MNVWRQLRQCATYAKFRLLLAIRLVSQTGDGLFQAGLATLFFFNPERATTPGGIALAFAVMLLPFSLVGPFAGPLLDRVQRRQVLVAGNALRVAVAFSLALAVIWNHWIIYVFALVGLGINRFLLSALSAGLPHTLPRELFVMANSIVPTLGSIATVIGAGVGLILSWAVPPAARDSATLVCAGLAFAAASLIASRFVPTALGPDAVGRASDLGSGARAVIIDLARGARYLLRRRTPALALAVMAIHRFYYAINVVALMLIARNLLASTSDAGLAEFAALAGISFAGNALAILATPIAHERLRSHTWIVTGLGVSFASQVVIAGGYEALGLGAFLMGFGVQSVKIAVDTIVQRDTNDRYRGRAFALYDMLFNIAFVSAAALAAALLPDVGWSRSAFAVLALAHLATAGWYWAATRGRRGEPVRCSS